jgi:hypothetical protein
MNIWCLDAQNGWKILDGLQSLCNAFQKRTMMALDFDGVITNPHALKVATMRRLGYPVSEQQSARETCVRDRFVPLEIYERAVFEVNVEKLLQVPLADGAEFALRNLAARCQLVVVTRRRDDEVTPVLRYVVFHGLPISVVINTARESKLLVLNVLSPKVYVEDSWDEMQNWIRSPIASCIPIYFVHTANQLFLTQLTKGVKAARGWHEVLNLAHQVEC